MKWESRQK